MNFIAKQALGGEYHNTLRKCHQKTYKTTKEVVKVRKCRPFSRYFSLKSWIN